jgi:hypothetical protein
MRNNIGFYIGFSLFAIQTITGDLYRDYKMKKYNENHIKLLKNKYNIKDI